MAGVLGSSRFDALGHLIPASQFLQPGNFSRIARKSGLATQHVSRFLKGRRGASFRVAAIIAHAAGVTLDELYNHVISQPGFIPQGRLTRGDRAAAMAKLHTRAAIAASTSI